MRWSCLQVVCLAFTAVSGAAGQAPGSDMPWPPSSLAVCDRLVASEPQNVRSYYCYSAVVRAGRGSRDVALQRVLALAARRPSSPHALYARALLLADREDPATEAAYAESIAAYDAAGDGSGRVRARVYLATYRSLVGSDRAIDPLLDAEPIARESGDPQLIALVTIDLATAAYKATDYGRAIRLLEGVEDVVRGRVAADLQSKWLTTRAAVAWALGDMERARAWYEQELALHRRTGNTFDEAVVLGNLALLASGRERIDFAQSALTLARRLGNTAGEVAALSLLAVASPDHEALAYLDQALVVARRRDDPEAISSVLRSKANRLVATRAADANAIIDEAIAVSRRAADRNELARNLVIRSAMRWEVGPRAQAIADSLEVLDRIEAMRNLQPEDRVRAQRFGQWRIAYYRAAGHLLAGHLLPAGTAPSADDREQAFHVIERLRARQVLDRLDASRAQVPVTADATLVARRRAVLERISRLNRDLAAPGMAPAARDALLAALEQAERDESEASAALAIADPRFASVRQPSLVSLAEVQHTLGPEEALVAFQVHPTTTRAGEAYGAWRWTITRGTVDVRRVPRPDALPGAVSTFLGLVASGGNHVPAVAAQVYTRLFDDALARLPREITRLVIVPDDVLLGVPFDALRPSAEAAPLAERFAISLAPSATTWWRLRQLDVARQPGGALVYADPHGASPWRAGVDGSSTTRADGTLVALPEARREGWGARRALGAASRLRSGSEATESAFKREALGDYRAVHFAAHAVLDLARPERTAILLASSDGDDGMLQVREIIDLPLRGQAVVLSACQSANGLLVPAEGLFGLSHAFVLAGARVVVANLWPVDDRDAADFIGLMYDGIGRGLSVRDAVHHARRESMARGRPLSAWAGMVVVGDGDLVLRSSRGLRWYEVAGLGLVALAFVGWITARRPPRERWSARS